MTYDDVSAGERRLSGALALVMHALFFALLVFGVAWQKEQPDAAMVVDLWSTLPPLKAEAPLPPPAPEPRPPPEPPRPAPRVEPRPAPKPDAVKPDIALKDKLDRERRLKEQEKEKAEAKRREQERAEAEKKRLAAHKEREAKEAEAKRLAQEQAEAQKKLAAQAAAQAAAARQKEIDEYKRRISDKIRRFIVEPPGVNPAAQVEFEITVLPGGEVLGAKLRRSSNSMPAYDAAVERAILRAQPLPVPSNPDLMREFRELNLVFRPKE